MQRAPGIYNNRSLKDSNTIYQLVSASIRSCTCYEHFLKVRFKLISPYFYLFRFKSHLDLIIIHSNGDLTIDLTIVFRSRWKQETNSDHSIVRSNSLSIFHLDMVGVNIHARRAIIRANILLHYYRRWLLSIHNSHHKLGLYCVPHTSVRNLQDGLRTIPSIHRTAI